jgi:hypothetical protein
VAEQVERTYRWRRRKVVQTRVTWVGMVGLFLVLLHAELRRAFNLGMTGTFGLFILVVVLPLAALVLWRMGLLPPERVAVEVEDAPPAPEPPAPQP